MLGIAVRVNTPRAHLVLTPLYRQPPYTYYSCVTQSMSPDLSLLSAPSIATLCTLNVAQHQQLFHGDINIDNSCHPLCLHPRHLYAPLHSCGACSYLAPIAHQAQDSVLLLCNPQPC
jgi:hypothetical protein